MLLLIIMVPKGGIKPPWQIIDLKVKLTNKLLSMYFQMY